LTSRTLVRKLAEFAVTKKAIDIVVIDLKPISSATDYFMVCSADSEPQVKAIAEAIREGAKSIDAPLWHSEGYQALSWVLLDFVDVVVHVFLKDAREFYNLERLWSDAKLQRVEDTGDGVRMRSMTLARTRKSRTAKNLTP